MAHIASVRNDVEMLSAIAPLANFGALDYEGRSPLMFACAHFNNPLIPLSATIAALAPWSDRQAVDHHGCDALMLAIENADSTGPASCAEITAILAPRVDVFSCDSLGESSLEKALDRGLANVAEIIQARMAILAERDALGLAASEPASPPSRKLTRI